MLIDTLGTLAAWMVLLERYGHSAAEPSSLDQLSDVEGISVHGNYERKIKKTRHNNAL